jgi:plastocyanin
MSKGLLRALLCLLVLLVTAAGACGGSSSDGTGGAGGETGGGTGGTGLVFGGTGGSAAMFMSIPPCPNESDYATGSMITFPNDDSSYRPRCLKIALNDRVTFMATTGTFQMHQLEASRARGNTAANPITSRTGAEAAASFIFGTPGFFGYYCRDHGTDRAATTEAGLIWVQ